MIYTGSVRSPLCFPVSQQEPYLILHKGSIGFCFREGERVGVRTVSWWCPEGAWKVMEGVWKVFGRCLECKLIVSDVSEKFLKGVLRVFGMCLKNVWKVSERWLAFVQQALPNLEQTFIRNWSLTQLSYFSERCSEHPKTLFLGQNKLVQKFWVKNLFCPKITSWKKLV